MRPLAVEAAAFKPFSDFCPDLLSLFLKKFHKVLNLLTFFPP